MLQVTVRTTAASMPHLNLILGIKVDQSIAAEVGVAIVLDTLIVTIGIVAAVGTAVVTVIAAVTTARKTRTIAIVTIGTAVIHTGTFIGTSVMQETVETLAVMIVTKDAIPTGGAPRTAKLSSKLR